MNLGAGEGRTARSRARGIMTVLAIAGLSATLGLTIPREAFAKEEPRFRCSRNLTCVLGDAVYCSTTCDDEGCGCDSWSDT
jgi:hypothetical protein